MVGCALAVGAFRPPTALAQDPERPMTAEPEMSPGEGFLLTGEAAGGLLLGEPQRSLFGPGGSLAGAAYRSLNPKLLVGLRLRGAAFMSRTAEDASRADPGVGGLGTLALALRLRPFGSEARATRALGLWVEGAGGAALTGELSRPVAEAGVGWGFAAGVVVLSPVLRYLHLFQSGDGQDGSDGKALLLGLEIMLHDPQPLPLPPRLAAPPEEPRDTDRDGILDGEDKSPTDPEDKDNFEDDDGRPEHDNDKDGIADKDDACPDQAEVLNGVDDKDGCPDEGLIQMIDDRVVLDEKLMFDSGQARVSSRGRRALQAVVVMWKQHPEWERLEVQGHADVRGSDRYNQWLSEERSKRVLAVLVQLGIPGEKLTSIGYGKTRPRAEGRSPEALQQNRRVELVMTRKLPAPASGTVPRALPAPETLLPPLPAPASVPTPAPEGSAR
jgi:outer membrane protein OmpA-like peptidoglycan-associated protein